jgi:hypothetical protein
MATADRVSFLLRKMSVRAGRKALVDLDSSIISARKCKRFPTASARRSGKEVIRASPCATFVAGPLRSIYFPTTPGAYLTSGVEFLLRLSADGSAQIYSTFTQANAGCCLVVDSAGDATLALANLNVAAGSALAAGGSTSAAAYGIAKYLEQARKCAGRLRDRAAAACEVSSTRCRPRWCCESRAFRFPFRS